MKNVTADVKSFVCSHLTSESRVLNEKEKEPKKKQKKHMMTV